MRKIIFSLVLAAFLTTGFTISAETVLTSSVGLTPDSPFYFLKTLAENIQILFTFNAEQKVRQYLHLADVRLVEYQKMLEKGKTELAQRSLDRYEKRLDVAVKKAEELKNKGKSDVWEEASVVIAKHITVLEENLQKVPESAKKGIEKALENAKKMEFKTPALHGETTTDASTGLKTYKNKQYEFKIKYPAQCVDIGPLSKPAILMIECGQYSKYSLIVKALNNPRNFNLKEFYDFYYVVKNPQNREALKEEVGSGEFIFISDRFQKADLIENIKLNGVPAVKFSYTGAKIISILGAERIFEIELVVSMNSPKEENILNQILSTFQFIEKDKINETNPATNSTSISTSATTSNQAKYPSYSPTPTNISVTCTDSDGGFNLYEKGIVIGTDGVLTESKTDYCNNKNVFEYYCAGGNHKPVASVTSDKGDIELNGEWEICPNGCSEGTCLR